MSQTTMPQTLLMETYVADIYASHTLIDLLISYALYVVPSYSCVTVEHALPPKNAMYPMGFDPGTSRIVSHRSTN